jgi:hypothetical protein
MSFWDLDSMGRHLRLQLVSQNPNVRRAI